MVVNPHPGSALIWQKTIANTASCQSELIKKRRRLDFPFHVKLDESNHNGTNFSSTTVESETSDAGMFCSCSRWRLVRISSVAADREKISFRNREQDSQIIPPSRGLKCQRVAH